MAPHRIEDLLLRDENQRIVRELLTHLPEHQRSALLLREQDDMSYREIALILDIGESKVKVDIFRAGGEQIVNRAMAEHLAGKTTYDVVNAFALKVLQNKGMLQPYTAPEATHYPVGFKDPQNYWVSLYSGYNVIGYNTKLVPKAEAPRNWEDLLNPRWKGKLGMDDEEYFWHAGMLKHWGEEKGRKYKSASTQRGQAVDEL